MKKYSYFILIIIVFFAGCKSFFEQTRENIIRTGEITAFFNTAQAEGLLFDVGTDTKKKIISYGHVWSLEDEPTIEDANDFKTDLGTTNTFGDYKSILADLSTETTYYVRAYAQNEEGISYGNTITFIPGLIRTVSVVNISTTTTQNGQSSASARANGTISSLINSETFPFTVNEIGFCISKQAEPTIGEDDTKKFFLQQIPSTNNISIQIFGLSGGVENYYIRAYVIYDNRSKISYGEELKFPTL